MYLCRGCWLKSVSCINIQDVGLSRCHVFVFRALIKIDVMYLYTGCWLKSMSCVYIQEVG